MCKAFVANLGQTEPQSLDCGVCAQSDDCGSDKNLRTAFTLVELLVVGTIIAILAILTLITMSMVANSTKEAKTRATIQKLDTAMQQIFEEDDRKAVAIRSRVVQEFHADTNVTAGTEDERKKKQELRETIVAHFVRDTMRMEMPQSWAEVYNSANPNSKLGPIPITLDELSGPISVDESPVFDHYWQAYRQVYQSTGKPPGRAALLFLIIQNLNPEALEAFHGSEVADTDGDGLLEFVDAWGKPILFLRWAPAFPGGGGGGGLQQDVLKLAGYVPEVSREVNAEWWRRSYWDENSLLRDAMQKARTPPLGHPDPFDGRKDAIGWYLYPLIYSAGPDGKYDIVSERLDGGVPASPRVRPNEILDPFAIPFGMPGDDDGNGTLNHFDNIHNHQWYRSY